MKIERVSETQMRFILCKADLDERNIKMNELAYGSDKTRQLFQEMMTLAQSEYEFESESSPLMLEAMRVGADSLIVVVTRIQGALDAEQVLNLIPEAKTTARLKRKSFIAPPPDESVNEDSISIFSFDTLDILAEAAARLRGNFTGISRAYKHEGSFFLMLQNETPDERTTDDLEAALFEYGQKHVSNALGRQYLAEYGDALITDGAVEKLSQYIGAVN